MCFRPRQAPCVCPKPACWESASYENIINPGEDYDILEAGIVFYHPYFFLRVSVSDGILWCVRWVLHTFHSHYPSYFIFTHVYHALIPLDTFSAFLILLMHARLWFCTNSISSPWERKSAPATLEIAWFESNIGAKSGLRPIGMRFIFLFSLPVAVRFDDVVAESYVCDSYKMSWSSSDGTVCWWQVI